VPAIYTVTVTDNNGCDTTADVTITEPALLTDTITSVINVSCNGFNDGEATATVTGGTPGYNYFWNSVASQFTPTATGLPPGTYINMVVDTNGCTATDTVVITQPDVLTASIGLIINVSCNAAGDGQATVIAGGGTLPYTYLWDDPLAQTGSTATVLDTGTYVVIVTDSNGCTETAGVTINEPAILVVDITDSTNIRCFGENNGDATVTAGGGTLTYTYLWDDDSTQTTSTATGLTAGNYNVIVTDNNGCTAIDSVTLTEPLLLIVSITGSTNVSCFGAGDGEVVSSASGGTLPYIFVWSDAPVFQPTPTATGLDGGTYTVTLIDSLGCDTTATATITEPALLVAPVTAFTNVGCKGDSTGSASVSASGGNPPYTYAWTTLPVQTDSLATGLPAGTYSITVTDSLGCDTTESVTITEPDSLLASITHLDVTCYGFDDGEATVLAAGVSHPLLSVTVTVYIAGTRPVAVAVVWIGKVFHE